jgi:hypothetical protein
VPPGLADRAFAAEVADHDSSSQDEMVPPETRRAPTLGVLLRYVLANRKIADGRVPGGLSHRLLEDVSFATLKCRIVDSQRDSSIKPAASFVSTLALSSVCGPRSRLHERPIEGSLLY